MLTGSQGYESSAPSRRVLLACEEMPFCDTVIARCGLPAAELASPVPEVVFAPGWRSSRAWKFRPSVPLYGRFSTSVEEISA